MVIKSITSRESVQENLDAWCLEVGTRFEKLSVDAVEEFIKYKWILKNYNKKIIDLGCGDGAATMEFWRLGYDVVGVDINAEKLSYIKGPDVWRDEMLDYVVTKSSLTNIFAHHSLEHTVDAPKVIKEIGKKLVSGGIYYATVPADDYLHSVHHVVFEDATELLPPNCDIIKIGKRIRFEESEYVCIAQKV